MPFFPQDLFLNLLSLERKRCERSGTRFALALFDVAGMNETSPFCDELCSHLRETDIPGWYRKDTVVGTIFTTLNGAPVPAIRAKLQSKIEGVAKSKVPFSLFIFPEDVSRELYPDVFIEKPRAGFHMAKRAIDILGSLAALIFLSPVFAAIAIAVKWTSPGPVLFRQKRLGTLGKEFGFLKFRSMYTGNNPEIHRKYVEALIQGRQNSAAGVFKIQNDPRVTKLGRFLRKTSLDELPQFLNVLKGEMSLVGPRPPIPYEMEKYSLWHRRRVLEAKPGITGLWQVRGRSRTTFDEMVRLDIQYIREQSLLLDLKILLQTPRAVLSASGAY